MAKVAPNSNFFGRFSEINLHSKIKRPLPHEAIIFTKFDEEGTKIVNFLLMANFWMCAVFSYSDLNIFIQDSCYIRLGPTETADLPFHETK